MAMNLCPQDGCGDDDLLLNTSETVLQMVGVARINHADQEIKVFYSHLEFHCVRLRDCLRRARNMSYRLNGELVQQALGHLGSLVPESGLWELPPSACAVSLGLRLGMLNLCWKNVRLEPGPAKVNFIGRWLRPGPSEEWRREVDGALEGCADGFDKQQSQQSFQRFTPKFEFPAICEPPCAVWRAAQSMFDALLDCERCSCPSQHEFGVKLGLGTYRKPESSKIDQKSSARTIRNRPRKRRGNNVAAPKLQFDMFLCMERIWHEVRVQTLKEKCVCCIVAIEAVCPCQSSAADVRGKVESLCRPMAKTKTKAWQRLMLKLTSGQLFEMGFEKSDFYVDKTAEPISLTRCFQERYGFFTEKTKRVLSLIIGYTVLHLNGTSWLQPGWGSANIKFFRTISRKMPLRPFIQTQLPKVDATGGTPDLGNAADSRDDDDDDDISDGLDLGHRCPAVIALAVVLMEIYFAKPFDELARMQHVPLIESPGGRITLIDVDQVFNGDEEMDKEGWRSQMPEDSPLLAAIDNCLDGELWEDEEGRALDSANLSSRIYKDVIRLLELHLTNGFSQIPLDDVDNYARHLDFGKWGQIMTSQELEGQAVPLPPGLLLTPLHTTSTAVMLPPPNQVGAQLVGPQVGRNEHRYLQSKGPASMSNAGVDYKACQFFDDEMDREGSSIDGTKRYLMWRSEYEKVYEKFIRNYETKPPLEPVKIAILDTGIDKQHFVFQARDENLRGQRNCYDESQNCVPDRNGHGTFAASLILDYAPDAMLYVIKIADKENARPDANIVVNAINHAVDRWGVDMISMSFGWPSSDMDSYDALQAAIDGAYNKKVLMFAAAANSGGRLGRAYPASSSHVICVHSTDTYGSASGFSPTAEPNAINIATVGESIESAWPMLLGRDRPNRRCVESRSGTSYATPIMAGIAAFLLHYARLHLPATAALALKRKEKMEALLRRCAEKGPNYQPRDGYFYVELSLNGHNLFGDELEWVKREMLKALRT